VPYKDADKRADYMRRYRGRRRAREAMEAEMAQMSEQPSCAHRRLERVEVHQSNGSQYEYWRCDMCHSEFRSTGSPRPGECVHAEA
jgi:hypothetical protein